MWICTNCGESIEDDFQVCWNCTIEKGEKPTTIHTGAAAAKPALIQSHEEEFREEEPVIEPKSKTVSSSASGLDFKKLARYIVLLGIIIFFYGLIKFMVNQPLSSNGSGGYFDAMNSIIETSDNNMIRAHIREGATTIMIAGGIIIFIGLAISGSTKTE